jgi:hypothetical protein
MKHKSEEKLSAPPSFEDKLQRMCNSGGDRYWYVATVGAGSR